MQILMGIVMASFMTMMIPRAAVSADRIGEVVKLITDIASRRALVTDLTRAVKYLDPQHRQDFCAELCRKAGAKLPNDLMMDDHQVRALSDSGLVDIGGHTVTHPILAKVDPEQARREIEAAARTVAAATALIPLALADVVAALIVRGWVECGCGNATGWVQVLRDPKLAKAIYVMHQQPGINWKVEDLARETGTSRSVFAERFLTATGTTPARYLTELRMRLAVQYISDEGQTLEKVAFRLGYSSLAAFSRAFKRITGQPPGASRRMARPT